MSYRAEVLATTPLAYWRLGEASGTVAAAEVGPAGAYANAPTLGVAGALVGDANTAVLFASASSQSVSIPTAMPAGSSVGASVVSWVRFTTAAALSTIFNWSLQSATVPYHWFYRDTSYLFWQFADGAAIRVANSSVWTPVLDQWYQLAVVHGYAAKTVAFYVNGVLLSTFSAAAFAVPSAIAAGRATRLAAYGTGSSFLNGGLDEPAVWNRALTAVEIDTLYRVGLATLTVVRSSDAGTGTETAGLSALIAALEAGTGTDLASPAVVAGGGTVTVTADLVSTVTVTADLLVGPN